MIRFVLIALLLATPLRAQDAIDPGSIKMNAKMIKAFQGKRDLVTTYYIGKLREFAVDGERLDLSTLDALVLLAGAAERGLFVGSFLGYDLNWAGVVERAEFNAVFSDDFPLTEGNLDAWAEGAANYDLDGNDTITIEELLTVAKDIISDGAAPSRLKEVIEMRDWDLNGDGYVTSDEVTAVIHANLP